MGQKGDTLDIKTQKSRKRITVEKKVSHQEEHYNNQ